MKFNLLKSCWLLLLALVVSVSAFAQSKNVSGSVMDESGKPLFGANVRVKGTDKGVNTDNNGFYSVSVTSNDAIIIVSHVGFSEQQIKVGDKYNLDIYLSPSNNSIDEVVVVGYGTQKRANIIGSIATVKGTEIEDLPVANLSTALLNKVPGVAVSQTSGKPGSTTNIVVRGAFTFAKNVIATPLYVIDGIQYPSGQGNVDGKEIFDALDASQIESITVLKDAEAVQYGSRGAAGVVLVTTKKGKIGKPKITYTGNYGISNDVKLTKMLTGYEQASLLNSKYATWSDYDAVRTVNTYTPAELDYLKTHNYNWADDLWRSSHAQRHNVNITGGTDKLTYFAGANYYDEDGNIGNNYLARRFGLRFGSTASITKNLSADVAIFTTQSTQNQPTPKGLPNNLTDQTDQANGLMSVLLLTPQWSPLTINGNYVNNNNGYAAGFNPLAFFNSGSYAKSVDQSINLNSAFNYKVPGIPGLTARVQYGISYSFDNSKQYYPSFDIKTYGTTGAHTNSSASNGNYNVINTDNLITTADSIHTFVNGNKLYFSSSSTHQYQLDESISYTKSFGKHDLNVMVLAEQSEGSNSGSTTTVNNQFIKGIDQLYAFGDGQGISNTVTTSDNSDAGRMSYLGKLNYSYAGKYLVEGILRADASPKFAPSLRWGYFPAVGIGWRISEENFFKDNVKVINDLKIRFNYGIAGNDNTNGLYNWYNRYNVVAGGGYLFGTTQAPGIGVSGSLTANPYLTWGRSYIKNLGIDGTILNRKFNFTLEGYYKHTDHDLMSPTSSVASTYGFSIADQNYAIFNNYGLEAALNYNGRISNNFTFNIGVNFAIADNRIIQKYYNPLSDTGYKYPIGRRNDNGIIGYQSTGIVRSQADADAFNAANPNWTVFGRKLQPGMLNFKDINGDGKIDQFDQTRIAERSGNICGFGFNLGAAWKGFRLAANIALGVGGTQVYDKVARTAPTETTNGISLWSDSWTPDNPNAKYPSVGSNKFGGSEVSSFWLVSSTFLRVNNMTLSYVVPISLIDRFKLPAIRLYVTGTNLWDIINHLPYKYSVANTPVDYSALRTYTFGATISL